MTSEKDGILRMQPSGRWAVCRPGRDPSRSRAAKCFGSRCPASKACILTRMEHLHGEGYFSVHGHHLHDGLRAAIESGE
jgi:hypothetical protein